MPKSFFNQSIFTDHSHYNGTKRFLFLSILWGTQKEHCMSLVVGTAIGIKWNSNQTTLSVKGTFTLVHFKIVIKNAYSLMERFLQRLRHATQKLLQKCLVGVFEAVPINFNREGCFRCAFFLLDSKHAASRIFLTASKCSASVWEHSLILIGKYFSWAFQEFLFYLFLTQKRMKNS